MFTLYNVFNTCIVEMHRDNPFSSLPSAYGWLLGTIEHHGGKLTSFDCSSERIYVDALVYDQPQRWIIAAKGVISAKHMDFNESATVH